MDACGLIRYGVVTMCSLNHSFCSKARDEARFGGVDGIGPGLPLDGTIASPAQEYSSTRRCSSERTAVESCAAGVLPDAFRRTRPISGHDERALPCPLVVARVMLISMVWGWVRSLGLYMVQPSGPWINHYRA